MENWLKNKLKKLIVVKFQDGLKDLIRLLLFGMIGKN